MTVTPDQYVLYGVEGSYYAAKARSYLQLKGLGFVEKQADRDAFAATIIPRVGAAIVPVLITPDDGTLQDTALIIDKLERRHPQPALIPQTPKLQIAAFAYELLADEWLKLPALHYRWYYDYEFAHTMMGYNNDPHVSEQEQRRVGAKIAENFRGWPQHLGVSDATQAAVEASFLECLDLLEQHFGEHPYALGARPSIADCALMGPLYAHLYRDPHSGQIVRDHAPALCCWIERMRAERQHTKHADDQADDVPASALAVLRHLAHDFVPVLCTALPMLQIWLGNNLHKSIPRYAGKHRFTMGRDKPYAAEGFRSIHCFEQWKVQRLLDRLSALGADVEPELEDFCRSIELSELFTISLPHRIDMRDYKLVHAEET